MSSGEVRVAVASAALLGESPFWHPRERALYYCDIPDRKLQRFDPASGALVQVHRQPVGKNPNWVEIVELP